MVHFLLGRHGRGALLNLIEATDSTLELVTKSYVRGIIQSASGGEATPSEVRFWQGISLFLLFFITTEMQWLQSVNRISLHIYVSLYTCAL